MRAAYEIEDGVREYIKTLKRHEYDPISREEERVLIGRYKKDRDLEARNRLIKANLRYACNLVNSFVGKGLTYFELISEVNDGLMESLDKYDDKYDVKLITYSKWWMLQRMRAAIERKIREDSKTIDIEEAPRTRKKKDDDEDDYEDTDNFGPVSETLEGDEERVTNEKNTLIDELYKTLEKREADILNLYFGRNVEKPLTLLEIGKIYNITKERVRKIVETAWRKLRSEAVSIDGIDEELFF